MAEKLCQLKKKGGYSSSELAVRINSVSSSANYSNAAGKHDESFSLTNIWKKMKVGGFTKSNASGTGSISGNGTILWSSSNPSTSEIDISSCASLSFSVSTTGAYQSCSINDIDLY